MAGWDNDTGYFGDLDPRGVQPVVGQFEATGDGALLIGSDSSPFCRVAKLTQGSGVTITNGNGTIEIAATGSGGTVTSVSGTTNRIDITGTAADPIVDIAATYVGQTSITTLGTIATGTWQGTAVTEVYGGTGQTSYTQGDILYSNAANSLEKLAIGTEDQVLTVSAGGVPEWSDAAAPDSAGDHITQIYLAMGS